MTVKKNIGIIGAGLSSLYAACMLSKKGYDVTVYEKNSMAGGRSQTFSANGFTFDMGPSWYWMPDLIDKLFLDIGEEREQYYGLHRLDPAYKIFWQDKETSEIPVNDQALYDLFDTFEKNGGEKLTKFLKSAKKKYNIALSDFIENPGLSLFELIKLKAIKGAFHLDIFKSVEKDVSNRFLSEKARSILNFPVLFLGAMPDKIPSMYTLMNFADLKLGTWYPDGGMNSIASALEKIAVKNGVKFHYNCPITSIESNMGAVTGIVSANGFEKFDYVISGADYHFTEQKLLQQNHRRYSEDYWDKRSMAPSSLIFYLGVDKKVANLNHHNLFFDESLKAHGDTIYSNKNWPEKPLFYACVPSITDDSVAPANQENIFILIPIAPNIEDSEATRDKYLDYVLDKLKLHTGEDIRDNITYKRSFCVADFKSEYNSFKGNAYGLANTINQTANLKPKIKSKLKNVFFCGQLTVPGPGIPPALISGKIAANQILQNEGNI
jgi:phytoene desaturase